jgi:chromosome segregation ATPase
MDMYKEAYRIAGDLQAATFKLEEIESRIADVSENCAGSDYLRNIANDLDAPQDDCRTLADTLDGLNRDIESLGDDLDYIHDNDERLSNLVQAIFDIDRGVATLDDVVDMAREASNYLPENCE